jgi:VWFA-related protein
MKIVFVLLCLVLFAVPANLRAQASAPETIQKGNKILINVPVTVSDREGRYISGLKKDDFILFQDGMEQKIAFFSTIEEPINVAILLDTSRSTSETLDNIKDAASDFIELLNPDDKCLIATFDSQVSVLNALTSDKQTLKNSLAKAGTGEKEGSVLLRAIDEVAQKSFTGASGRKVIIVLSDGKDFGSPLTKSDLFSRLEESDVSIYSIFYQTGLGFNKIVVEPDGTVKEGKESKPAPKKKAPKPKKNYSILIPLRGDVYTEEEAKVIGKAADIDAVNSLREMSDLTAGRFYQSDTPNLGRIFKQIAGELRQQYQLGFQPKDAAAGSGVHDIIVKVKERSDVVVRARGKFRAGKL